MSLGKYSLVSALEPKKESYWLCENRQLVSGIDKAFRQPLLNDWKRTVEKANTRKANQRLDRLKSRFKFGMFNISDTNDDSVNDYARTQALKCVKLLRDWPEYGATEKQNLQAIWSVTPVCELHEFKDFNTEGLLKLWEKGKSRGILLRLKDENWWRRRIRSTAAKRIEEISRDLGFINRVRDIYCSGIGEKEYKRRKQLNLSMMESTVLENNEGQQYTLADLAELSNANPIIRRTELMVRIAGFELYAKELGYKPYFFTITCPSKYHAFHKFGHRNHKFNGASQRAAQDYLCNLWARFRSQAKRITNLKRYEWEYFGFRVAEPHHDGTPHWHLILFINPDHVEQVIGALRSYALEEDGDERGAWEHRFQVEKIKEGINPDTGKEYSAAGYIAKYISKSIDGEHVDTDHYDHDAKASAKSIVAWSSRNGIRQFQQVRGPSVSVWRELRRLGRLTEEEQEELDPLLKNAVEQLEALNEESAASAWHWYCRFADENGLSLWKVEKTIKEAMEVIDQESGEIYSIEQVIPKLNHYGEFTEQILGLKFSNGVQSIRQKTRFYEWKIVAKTRDEAAAIRAENKAKAEARKQAKQNTVQEIISDALAVSERSSPWTGVNNCTERIEGQVLMPDHEQLTLAM